MRKIWSGDKKLRQDYEKDLEVSRSACVEKPLLRAHIMKARSKHTMRILITCFITYARLAATVVHLAAKLPVPNYHKDTSPDTSPAITHSPSNTQPQMKTVSYLVALSYLALLAR